MVFAVIFFAVAIITIVVTLTLKVDIPRRAGFLELDSPGVVRSYDFMNHLPPFAVIRLLVANTLSRRKAHGSLVDVGCGPGYLLAVIAKRFLSLHLIGVDLSKEILSVASRNLISVSDTRLELLEGDSERLPLPENSVEYLVSTLSLHHWPHPEKAFREFYRVLKPCGTLLVFDLKRDAKFLFYFLIRFVTGIVVPRALREVKEPLGSLLSAYNPIEVLEFMSGIKWKTLTIKPGFGWMTILCEK
jgi:ubiquinone/menaquinone biosynthesis C-methylase UbiE